jgi:hypothetical protein
MIKLIIVVLGIMCLAGLLTHRIFQMEKKILPKIASYIPQVVVTLVVAGAMIFILLTFF